MNASTPIILVLGAEGMLGRTVYTYLRTCYPSTTYGTVKHVTRANSLFFFDAYKPQLLETIYKKIGHIDYIINCIGIVRSSKNKKDMKAINQLFPHKLVLLAKKHNSKLIHVSTDAVFAASENAVYENTPPFPNDFYGKTKLHGEPEAPNALTIRTSLLGFDPNNHKGLLEWALSSEEPSLPGFTNQLWSGCTTLQFAKLCEAIIFTNSFKKTREVTSVYHFAPLARFSKHAILVTFVDLMGIKKKIRKVTTTPITRLLKTNYPQLFKHTQQEHTLNKALKNLLAFENTYEKQ